MFVFVAFYLGISPKVEDAPPTTPHPPATVKWMLPANVGRDPVEKGTTNS